MKVYYIDNMVNKKRLVCCCCDDSRARTVAIVLAVALVVVVPYVRPCRASYSCCSEERRGAVCTLAGSGAGATIDSSNATVAAINAPLGVALYPPHRIIVGGLNENRLRIIHPNGSVSTLAGCGSANSHFDSDDPLTARFSGPMGAARAIVASGAASAALAGIVATTSMGHATRMGALMRSVECAFAAGELDPPSVVELPLQWSIESQGGSLGSHAGSALLTSALLVVLPLFLCALVHAILSSCGASERPVLRSLQCNVLSRYCLLSMAFFPPNVLMSAVVVVGRGASSGAVVAAVCAATVPLLLGCVAGQRALAMDVEVVPLCGGKWELRNRPSSSAYVETFGGLVDGCRDPMPLIVRACFLEDAVASLVLSFLSGVSLSTARCEWVALAMLAVSALHLLYVVCVHPLRSRVESAMNCGLCAVQVVMAALCLAIASGADSSGGLLMSVLGVVAVVQNASFFSQAVVLGACACVIESRKRHSLTSDCISASDAMMAGVDHHALLATPDPMMVPPLMSAA